MRTSSAVGTLFVATVLCYSPLLGGGFEFLSWDDTTNTVLGRIDLQTGKITGGDIV